MYDYHNDVLCILITILKASLYHLKVPKLVGTQQDFMWQNDHYLQTYGLLPEKQQVETVTILNI